MKVLIGVVVLIVVEMLFELVVFVEGVVKGSFEMVGCLLLDVIFVDVWVVVVDGYMGDFVLEV